MTVSLISKLRARIKDTRYSVRAIGLAVTDDAVQSAIAEVTNGHLIVTVVGGTAPPIDFNLSKPQYATVGRLHQQLDRLPGYRASLDEDAEITHLTLDCEPFGPVEIAKGGSAVDLRHRVFSESELETVLDESITRHNPSFSMVSLPAQEEVFVLHLAQASVCRIRASDASKRKGMDADVGALISLASSFETAYKDDTYRLKRALASPKEATPNTMGQGDIVLGSQFRRNLRTGFTAPMAANLPPDAAVLLPPDERDEGDEDLRFRWQRNRDYDFYSYELWLDTRPEVMRVREGLIFTSVPFSATPTGEGLKQGFERPTTSQLIFRSFGASSNFDTAAFSTFVEEFGQLITSYVQQKLEPDTEYFARLYIVDLNYETVASNVMRYKTKALRTKFIATNSVSPAYGPAGTVVTVNFDPAKGPFTVAHKILLGGKEVSPITIISPFQVSFVVPVFVQKDSQKDLAVVSPTELFDVYKAGFRVTSV